MTELEYARAMRQIARETGMCVRHPYRPRNPRSKSHCDFCLDMYRARYTPKGGHGRNLIPRGTA